MIGFEVVGATVVGGAALDGGALDDGALDDGALVGAALVGAALVEAALDGAVVALDVPDDVDTETEGVVGREVELDELDELEVEVLLSERYQFLGSSPRQEPTVTPVHPLAFMRSK